MWNGELFCGNVFWTIGTILFQWGNLDCFYYCPSNEASSCVHPMITYKCGVVVVWITVCQYILSLFRMPQTCASRIWNRLIYHMIHHTHPIVCVFVLLMFWSIIVADSQIYIPHFLGVYQIDKRFDFCAERRGVIQLICWFIICIPIVGMRPNAKRHGRLFQYLFPIIFVWYFIEYRGMFDMTPFFFCYIVFELFSILGIRRVGGYVDMIPIALLQLHATNYFHIHWLNGECL